MKRSLAQLLDRTSTIYIAAAVVAGPRPVLHVRVGAASVGMAGHRSVSRSRVGARARRTVRDDRRAVGLRLLRRGVLLAVWRPDLGAGHRAGAHQRRRPHPALSPGPADDLATRRRALGRDHRGVFVQQPVRVHPGVRRDLHRPVSCGAVDTLARDGDGRGSRWFAVSGLLSGLVPQFRPNLVLLARPWSWLDTSLYHRTARHVRDMVVYGALVVRGAQRRGSFATTSSPGCSCPPARTAACSCGTARCRSARTWKAAPTTRGSIFESAPFKYTSLADTPLLIEVDGYICTPPSARADAGLLDRSGSASNQRRS